MTNTASYKNQQILDSLVKRIQRYSKDFSEYQKIIDEPWEEVSYHADYRKFIFTEHNRLIVAVSGRVTTGEWKLIPLANSLLLTFQGKATLYKRFFLDDALLILKRDGPGGEYCILVNENKIPDLHVENYVYSKYAFQHHGDPHNTPPGVYHHTFLLSDGQSLQFRCKNHSPAPKPGDTAFIKGEKAKDGRYLLNNNRTIIEVKDQKYFRKLSLKTYRLKTDGTLKVEQDAATGMRKGAKVWLDGRKAPDGKYKIGWLNYLKVKNGEVA